MRKPKRAAIYLRVSTDGQTVDNQRRDLEAAAERHGWQVVATFADNGVSGAKGRDQRPGLDALLKGATRREFDATGPRYEHAIGPGHVRHALRIRGV